MIPDGEDVIRVRFSEPMTVGIQGLMKIDGYEMLPFDFKASFWEDDRTFVIKPRALEPGEKYGACLPQGAFLNENMVSIAEDYRMVFKAE